MYTKDWVTRYNVSLNIANYWRGMLAAAYLVITVIVLLKTQKEKKLGDNVVV